MLDAFDGRHHSSLRVDGGLDVPLPHGSVRVDALAIVRDGGGMTDAKGSLHLSLIAPLSRLRELRAWGPELDAFLWLSEDAAPGEVAEARFAATRAQLEWLATRAREIGEGAGIARLFADEGWRARLLDLSQYEPDGMAFH